MLGMGDFYARKGKKRRKSVCRKERVKLKNNVTERVSWLTNYLLDLGAAAASFVDYLSPKNEELNH